MMMTTYATRLCESCKKPMRKHLPVNKGGGMMLFECPGTEGIEMQSLGRKNLDTLIELRWKALDREEQEGST